MIAPEFEIEIREDDPFPIDLRQVWTVLQSRRQFANWARTKLSQLVENEDYVTFNRVVKAKVGRGASSFIEYRSTIDAAKHIALMERTDRGRQVREYFIAAEKTLRGIVTGEIAAPAAFSPIADLQSKIAAFQFTSPESVRTYAMMLALEAKLGGALEKSMALETEDDPVGEDLAALIATVVEAGKGEPEIVIGLEHLLRCAHDLRLLGWCIPRRLRPNWQVDRRTQSAFGKLVASRVVGRRFQTPKGEYLAARLDGSRRSSIALIRRHSAVPHQ